MSTQECCVFTRTTLKIDVDSDAIARGPDFSRAHRPMRRLARAPVDSDHANCIGVYITDSVYRQSRLPLRTGALCAAEAFRFVDFSQNCELRFGSNFHHQWHCQCFSAIMHRIDPREGGNTVLCHKKARRRTMDDRMTRWYPCKHRFA